ncbi:MAG: hypothetical protein II921_09415 [Treponema sp.]|nr:hypothetical protein [Treponema sp.]
MKKVFGLLMFFVCMGVASAKIASTNFEPTRSEEEFDVMYYKFPSFEIYDVPDENQQEVGVNQAFKATFNGCEGEIRYSLFKETGKNTDFSISSYAYTIALNIAGEPSCVKGQNAFSESDVANNFNGTSGLSYFIMNPQSRFAGGYLFASVECFYKKGQGLCVRTTLFNEPEFFGIKDGQFDTKSDWAKYYKSFKFMEKDKAGKYIKRAVK